jgi:manganese transport protein
MPHNLYLHSSLVQTRSIKKTTKGIRDAIKFNFIDSTIALNLAFFVNAAILISAAAAFHQPSLNDLALPMRASLACPPCRSRALKR